MLTADDVRKLPYGVSLWVFPQPSLVEEQEKAIEECFQLDGGVLKTPVPFVWPTPRIVATANDFLMSFPYKVSMDVIDAGLAVATMAIERTSWISEEEFPHEEMLGGYEHFIMANVTFKGVTKLLWQPIISDLRPYEKAFGVHT